MYGRVKVCIAMYGRVKTSIDHVSRCDFGSTSVYGRIWVYCDVAYVRVYERVR
jgi:hypothetical protein